MANFLFVHGTGHGAWCWRDVIPEMATRGHHARAMDLPCHGADDTPIAQASLARYAAAIIAEIDGPTIVVGHSMGGFPITEAAILALKQIQHLVYLCAYVPEVGKSLVEMRKAWPTQPLAGAFDVADDQQSFRFLDDKLREKLYQDCPEVLDFARANLCAEPMQPSLAPCTGRPETSASYIVCENDKAIDPDHQRDMARRCDAVYSLPTGHSPFFKNPAALADILTQIAASLPRP